ERRQLLDADAAPSREPQRLRVERLLEDRPREARVAEPLAARRAVEDRPEHAFDALAEAVLGLAREPLSDRDQLVGGVVGEDDLAREARAQPRVRVQKAVHEPWIAGRYHH